MTETGRIGFGDLSAGQTIALGGYTPSTQEIIGFARSYDPQPVHLDDDAARTTILGGLSASGWHTCAIIMRLIAEGLLNRAESMGSNGVEAVKWLKPVRPGEPLAAVMTILETRISASRPGMGIVRFRVDLADSGGDRVCEMTGVFFLEVAA